MRHRKLRRKLGVTSDRRKALLRNLVKSLVERKKIRTTLTKAKAASSLADKMVQLAKRGDDLHVRRQIISKLGCAETAKVLIKDIAPHFKTRNGGYTRVLRLGARSGDAAETALLEFTATIEAPEKPKKAKTKKKSKPAKSSAPSTKKSEGETAKKEAAPEEAKKDKGKKETDKKGGFLGTLRKFLKGDEQQ